MKRKMVLKNINNTVTKKDYKFWQQILEFKDSGLGFLIPIAIELNKNWLDAFDME